MADKLRKFKSIGEEDRTFQRRREKNRGRYEAQCRAEFVDRDQFIALTRSVTTINR